MNTQSPAEKAILRVARDAITANLDRYPFLPPHLEPPYDKTHGVFVTLYGPGRELRGCIGHIQGVCDTLAEEVAECAVAAAFEDPRFPPLTHRDLEQVTLELSLLGPLEAVDSPDMLDARSYGVVVSNGHRRGVLLPDIEGVDTVEQQLSIARRKAGILPGEHIAIQRFRVDKIRERP